MNYLEELYVDTTVQEKNISYPSEANLLNRARAKLVKLCEKHHIILRQKYTRVGKVFQIKAHRYAQASQWNRCRRVIRKLRTILGRIIRELHRIVPLEQLEAQFKGILELATKLYHSPDTKEKVLSLHEPHVEAIAKGKIHKKFEFGNKVSVVRTRKAGFILGCKALHGNPYDGHTLRDALSEVENRFGAPITAKIGVDLGYRGHKILKTERHQVFHPRLKRMNRKTKLFVRARSSVEASISYLKRCFRMGKNYLKGKLGDILNALFAASALNLTKIAKAL
jgi:IS5 family transposase